MHNSPERRNFGKSLMKFAVDRRSASTRFYKHVSPVASNRISTTWKLSPGGSVAVAKALQISQFI